MKKLLYVSVNSKPEEESTSKTVARKLIDKIIKNEECEVTVEEVDVYKDHIPTLTHEYFCGRNTLCKEEDYEGMNHRARNEVDRIKDLANQFKEADIYVVASPMWSLFFPAPFKQYLDCVIQNEITIEISEKKCKGLLDDKERRFYFVQSSGGDIPVVFKGMLDHSSCYLKDIIKFMGISKYKEILVDGTGFTKEDREDAMEAAEDHIDAMFKVGNAIDKACECYKKDGKEFMQKMKGHHKHSKDGEKCCHSKDDENMDEKEESKKEDEKKEGKSFSDSKKLIDSSKEKSKEEDIVKVKEDNYAGSEKEPEEELTEEKKETYEKMENDEVLNEESAKEYN